jgi:hypothetical protein
MKATGAEFTGTVNAVNGTIGSLTVGEVESTI